MNERVKKVVTVVKDKWSGFAKMTKILIIAVPIAVIAIIIILAILLNHKDDAVLFSALTTDEAGEVSQAIVDLGVTDVTINSNGDVIVPDDQVDYLRMQLAVQGYPKNPTNYNLWNDSVDLWSTDSDKREIKRQQRETRLAATLVQLDAIQSATVNLDVPETKDYVLIEDKGIPKCSVTLRLKDGEELTNAEVRAIFSMITTSVDGLTIENVSVIDTLGREYEWISAEEEKNGERDASGVPVARRRLQFQNEYREAIMQGLKDFFGPAFGEGNYSVNVAVRLNYDNMTQQSTEYIPSGDDNTGVLDHSLRIDEATAIDPEQGIVGVTPDGDLSPDYPTYVGLEDGQSYYYNKDEFQYDVSNIVTNITKDGYSIEKLSVALLLNTNALSQAEIEMYSSILANAAGTTIDNVSVANTVFALPSGSGTTVGDSNLPALITSPHDPYRDVLLYVVIALGILLILLLILSLFMSKSRKKKIRRRQELALAAAAANGIGINGATAQTPESPEEIDFNIASLTEAAGKDSRETILKREIMEFSKNSPEIVAQIIKNMLREE